MSTITEIKIDRAEWEKLCNIEQQSMESYNSAYDGKNPDFRPSQSYFPIDDESSVWRTIEAKLFDGGVLERRGLSPGKIVVDWAYGFAGRRVAKAHDNSKAFFHRLFSAYAGGCVGSGLIGKFDEWAMDGKIVLTAEAS